jgi:hypothetical protein
VTGLVVLAVGACGPFCLSGKVVVTNAHMDSQFSCPKGSKDLGYDAHGTLQVDNQTSHTLTIKSIASAATVVKVSGLWGGKVGDKSGADNLTFSPKTIASGSKATVKFSSPWNCSNAGGNAQTYADFSVVITVVTSSGTYKVSSNNHRILIP